MRPVVNLQGVALPFTWKRENLAFGDELEESYVLPFSYFERKACLLINHTAFSNNQNTSRDIKHSKWSLSFLLLSVIPSTPHVLLEFFMYLLLHNLSDSS